MTAPYRRILIPIDGSPLSLSTVERLDTLLSQPGLSVTLMRVIDEVDEKAARVDVRSEQEFGAAKESLHLALRPLKDRGIAVDAEVSSGIPADEILRQIERGTYDLIAMSTHGRTGLRETPLGRVAKKVLHSCPIPLLLLHPFGMTKLAGSELRLHKHASFNRILVPLDGSSNAEEILPAAQKMASAFHSSMFLFQAVPPGDANGEGSVQKAEDYLSQKKALLRSDDMSVTLLVRKGDPSEEVLAVVREYDMGIVAIATHGHPETLGSNFGSVAEILLGFPNVPTLVVQTRGFRKSLPIEVEDARHRPV